MKLFKKIIPLFIIITIISTAFLSITAEAATKKITVSIKNSHAQILKGKKISVKATLKNAKIKKVTYKSSNKKIATVSSKGLLKAKKVGTAKITVNIKATNGKTYIKTTKIYVYKKKSDKKTTWIPEKGHYENITKKVWVPNIVEVSDNNGRIVLHELTTVYWWGYKKTEQEEVLYDANTKECIKPGTDLLGRWSTSLDGQLYTFYNDANTLVANHPDHAWINEYGLLSISDHSIKSWYTRESGTTPKEDYGSYKKKVIGKKWVVDRQGYWK